VSITIETSFARTVECSLGVVTHGINTAIVTSCCALVNIWNEVKCRKDIEQQFLKPDRHITSVLNKKGKELNKTPPVQFRPSPSCPCLHLQLNAPLVLLHTASELQLRIPVAHSSISKERTRWGDLIFIEVAVIDCVQTFYLLSKTCSFGPILRSHLTSTRASASSLFIFFCIGTQDINTAVFYPRVPRHRQVTLIQNDIAREPTANCMLTSFRGRHFVFAEYLFGKIVRSSTPSSHLDQTI